MATENKTLKLEIRVTERKTKEGKKFNSFEVLNKDGRFMDCRFRKEVKQIPEDNCFINVLPENVSVDSKRKYPRVWIHQVESIEDKYSPDSNPTVEKYFE